MKKDTIIDNSRTITQEGDISQNQTNDSIFSSVKEIHFCIEKLSTFIFMGSPFGSFWSAKYLNFGSKSCENRILSRSIQETYTLRKIVKRDFTVSIEFRINSKIFSVISWSTSSFTENNAEKLRNLENLKSNLSKYRYLDSLIKQGFQKALSTPQKDLQKPKKPLK